MLTCANCPRLAAIRDHHNSLVRAKLAAGVANVRAQMATAALEAFRADMSRGVAVAPAPVYPTVEIRWTLSNGERSAPITRARAHELIHRLGVERCSITNRRGHRGWVLRGGPLLSVRAVS